jgi:photosystem II stability/assembly factor-like uncharacterized protein
MKRYFHFISFVVIIALISTNFSPIQAANVQDTNQATGVWTCWDDGTLDPCHNFSLNSVSMVSITDGWAVGENGSMLRWNGYKWSINPVITSFTFNAVQMRTASDGWSIGDSGTVLRWNGSIWSSISFPNGSNLFSISIVSSNNVWIAGWNIYNWNGSEWSQVSTPNNYSRAISMVPGSNGTDGWAVGYKGSILRWNGSLWTAFDSPTGEYLYDIIMISSTDGWIVGNKGTFLHWNGTSWSIVPVNSASPYSSVWEVDGTASGDIWAIGFDNGTNNIWHWNGSNWFLNDGNADGIAYSGITVTPGTNGQDAWVVGESANILHWNNTSWTPINEPYTKRLHAIKMLSPTDGWIGGSAWPVAPGDALHWNGSDWKPEYIMDSYGLDFYTSPEGTIGWSVGVWGEISKWDGINWYSVNSPSKIDLTSVDIISADDAWAVGMGNDPDHGYQYHGVIAHFVDNEWITVTLPTTSTMVVDVSMLSPTSGWAVGTKGTILEWQGAEWQITTSPTVEGLSAIEMLDASNCWIVGGNGTILHWDGSTWSTFSSPTTAGLTDVKFTSLTNGWAVGVGGTILRWDGISWTQVDSPSTQTILAIAYSSPYELWAVGFTGFILHYEFNPILTINYSTGAPGSFFTLDGSGFPPDSSVDLSINVFSLGSIQSDSTGSFHFILSTSQADEGFYNITASVNPRASVRLILDNDSPIRPQEGFYDVFDVPSGIAYAHAIYLPLTRK